MTMDGGTEIPPLDGAADISRSTEEQPGQTLSDPRYWPAFVLLLFGGLAAIVTLGAAVAGAVELAIVSAILACIAIAAGVAVVVVNRGRRASTTSSGPLRRRAFLPPGR